jgi:arabinogalactan oligomer/maltooligosaccharide transport system substrate-binding protein
MDSRCENKLGTCPKTAPGSVRRPARAFGKAANEAIVGWTPRGSSLHHLIRVSLVFSAACLLLVACSNAPRREGLRQGAASPEAQAAGTPAAQPILLTYWEEEGDDGDVLLDSLANEFMRANPHVKVERVHFGYEELLDKLKTADAPDLVRCLSDCAGPFSKSGRFRPADGLFDRAFLDRFFHGALAAATVSGTLWGIPDNYGNHLMLIYNKDLVRDVPSDTDAWISQFKTLTQADERQYGLSYFLEEPYWLVPWIGGFGGWLLDSHDNPTLDTQATIDALQFVRSLKTEHQVVPPVADYDIAFDYFKQGLAAYLIDGDWSLDRLRDAGANFGVTPLPRVSATGLDPTPVTSGKFWFVGQAAGKDAARLDAARQFAEFMTSARAQERWLDKAGRLPSAVAVAKSPKIAASPILSGAMAQLSRGRGLPPAPEMRCVWSAMRPGLEAVLADRTTPAAAAKAMQAEAVACVEKMRAKDRPDQAR